MPNEDQMWAGAGLDLWFAQSVSDLVGTIRNAAGAGGTAGIAPQNARAYLMTIRDNAELRPAGLDEALSGVLRGVTAIETLTGDLFGAALRGGHSEAVEAARLHAIEVLSHLVDVLRTVKPSPRAAALYPQPGQPDYRAPGPV